MKKKYIIIPAIATLGMASCSIEDTYYGETYDPAGRLVPPYEVNWQEAADSVDNVLTDHFLDADRGTFYVMSDNMNPDGNWNCYWPQAHAMDVIVDAYLRIKDKDAGRKSEYEEYMELWHQNRANNYSSPGFKNNYTDDMEWIVMTLVRMHEATGKQDYLDSARETYDNYIRTRFAVDIANANGAKDPNGNNGLRWYYDESSPLANPGGGAYSLNACSNGPGAICAMRLYNFTDDAKYLEDAKRIYEWLSSVLYNPETGAVSDNICNGSIGGGALSYNQGTFIGAAHLLYTATGDIKYKTEAMRAARYQMNSMTTDGVMNAETDAGNNDNALFKGIFVRYAVLLVEDDAFDAGFRKELSDFLKYNAIVAWTSEMNKDTGYFSYDWKTSCDDPYGYLQAQVSGSTLIEAAARLF